MQLTQTLGSHNSHSQAQTHIDQKSIWYWENINDASRMHVCPFWRKMHRVPFSTVNTSRLISSVGWIFSSVSSSSAFSLFLRASVASWLFVYSGMRFVWPLLWTSQHQQHTQTASSLRHPLNGMCSVRLCVCVSISHLFIEMRSQQQYINVFDHKRSHSYLVWMKFDSRRSKWIRKRWESESEWN